MPEPSRRAAHGAPGRLQGKRTLITGASRGIGADLSRAFAGAGASLVLTARDGAALSEQAAELAATYPVPVEVVVADLSGDREPERLAEAALAVFGGLDVLVNNAGISYPELVVNLTAVHLDDVLNVNLRAPALLAARVGAAMAAAGSGSIISIASAAGSRALLEHYGYCISKAGLVMATNVLALELGPSGVRANSISPTVTLTCHGTKSLARPTGEGGTDAGPDPAPALRLPPRGVGGGDVVGVRLLGHGDRGQPCRRRRVSGELSKEGEHGNVVRAGHSPGVAAQRGKPAAGLRARMSAPDGGAGWLAADGSQDPTRPVFTWVTARMAHVYGLGYLLGVPGSRPIAEKAIEGLDTVLRDSGSGGWFHALNADGTRQDTKTAYGHAFVILAAATGAVSRPRAGGRLAHRRSRGLRLPVLGP